MSRRAKKKTGPGEVPAVRSSAPASPAGEMPGGADSRSPESECRPAGLNDRWRVPGVCLFLAAIIWVVFGQTLGHEFVNYDDDLYVYENPVVQKGLTWEGFRWALTYGQIGHWHPLTWLSHMLDCQLYGLQAGGHHLTNILLHTATAILLFLVLRQMTGFLWRSAFVAAVFAIHPLRVESVAWVAERKDVLSAFFFMLTLGAYVRYVRRPPSKIRYGVMILLYALGLLSKNMLVTMPFVLLLLDYWPLNRLSGFSPRVLLRRVAEKIPLFVLAVGSCVATALMPEKVPAEYMLSFALRMENAVVSYVTYLWQMIHPSGLACVYPNPVNDVPLWQVAGALGLLLAISGVAWAFRKTHPCLVVGWLWYLGMLIPVIGMVQISYYAHADRYTYLPQIGLYLLLTWAAADLCAGWRHRRVVLGGGATVILVALIFCARTQASYWRNSELLWTHTLACTSDNFIGHNNLGNTLLQEGNMAEAVSHFQKALQIKPGYAEAHNNLGNTLLQKGSVNEAMVHYQKALQIKPDYAEAHYNLGNALLKMGNVGEAIAHFQKALQIKPDYAEAHNNLGNALLQKGNVAEAIIHYQKALQIKPDNAEARNNLGNALLQEGNVAEAIAHFQKALQIKPDFAEAHYNLGNALLQKGNVAEAIIHYQKALQIKPDYAEAHINLGNALLQKGNVAEAIVHYQKALQINPDFAEARNNLGNALLQKGNVAEAIAHFQRALQIKPGYAGTHYNLGNALLKMGNVDEAISHYQKALQIKPDYAEAQNTLAWVLATCPQASLRNGNKAVKLAQRANQLTGDGNPVVLGTLAAAYAEAGRFPEAVATAQRALQVAETQSNPALADAIRSQMKLYQAGLPFHLH
jgi:tetratricopeptide (TPR) repeat protein